MGSEHSPKPQRCTAVGYTHRTSASALLHRKSTDRYKSGRTPVKQACILLYLNTVMQTWASARTVSLSWCSIYVSCVTSSCRNSSSLYTSVKWSWMKSSTAAFNSGQSMHSARAEMPTRGYKKIEKFPFHHFHNYFILKLNIIKCLEVSIPGLV